MFVVLITPALPDHARGYLSRFFIEPNPNIFVGVCSHKVAEQIWGRVISLNLADNVTMVQSAGRQEREQGYLLRVHGGKAPRVIDFDGIDLIAREVTNEGTQ